MKKETMERINFTIPPKEWELTKEWVRHKYPNVKVSMSEIIRNALHIMIENDKRRK
jgi:hypothetical protein